MTKRIVYAMGLVLAGTLLKAQSSKTITAPHIASNCERYKKDYEIKGWSTIQDTAKLNALNLEYYDSIREQLADKEVSDAGTGLTVIVYSVGKTIQKKNE